MRYSPTLLLVFAAVSLPGRLASQSGAFPSEVLQPSVVPWEPGGPQFALHTKEKDAAPFAPHRIMANVYYVGQADNAAYLITTSQGHILIDTTYEDGVPLIQKSVEQLKFRFQDIKILLLTRASADQAQGARRVKELTGAQVMVMDEDAKAMESGANGIPAVKVDRALHDKDVIQLDGDSIVAYRTPGSTPGNTTYVWKARQFGDDYAVVLAGDMSSDARTLAALPRETMLEDYRYSFRFLKSLQCDVFLAGHGKYFSLQEKHAAEEKDGTNPYIDPNGYKAYIKLMELSFYYKLDAIHREATQ